MRMIVRALRGMLPLVIAVFGVDMAAAQFPQAPEVLRVSLASQYDSYLPWPDPGVATKAAQRADLFGDAKFGDVVIRFEETKLASLAKLMGGKIQHQGDAGESYYWICYRLADGSAVGLFSGEMGNGTVNEFALTKHPPQACPVLPVRYQPVRGVLGLGLGARYDEFAAQLGKPQGRAGDRATWISIRPLPQAQDCSLSQSLNIAFRDGRAVNIVAGQIGAC